MAKKKEIGYEEALKSLESLLDDIENKDIPIDELSKMVDESMELLKICKAKLRGAEGKIEHAFQELDK
ncbi:exodeoxyribonuclease VII small subunit [Marivirga sp. S37H4]|uniref:Exodeoxyribonuclease VII small subunit n=1 Tax=Marivirga aurantiaca TaxID=2802615 RepID=A0A934WXY3_9BACT|nr:exodeoxyribonuclease VII small subunit [Marivirga aurantiaca]MBK6264885.1 exodeoxyribonuclease VII small subunit [Marivirga aurantiaca]